MTQALLFVVLCFVHLFFIQVQSFSNDEHSPEPADLLRFSPLRNNRYSMTFAPPSYSSIATSTDSHCFSALYQKQMNMYIVHMSFVHNEIITKWLHLFCKKVHAKLNFAAKLK